MDVSRVAPARPGLEPEPAQQNAQENVARPADPDAPYEIIADPDRHYLEIRFRGIWDIETFDAFASAYLRVTAEMLQQSGIDYSLIDASRFGVQSPDITERFPELVHNAVPDGRRSAVVVPAIVNKIQARQAGDLLNARYFRAAEDAIEWLFGDEA